MRLAGKIAIVTGASSGLGKAMAEMFIKEGAKVVFSDINPYPETLPETGRFFRADTSSSHGLCRRAIWYIRYYG
ncbi:hypothetical protein COT98_04265 [Candidatus Falkowbacteria bacterium CG10_big_fil_rev_8_21_14_0_10_39_9]|uniref:Short-chain dehydrogenase n=1 Tax=Candidatus Falkowbacteria bacterium CG10_big_fil_rev_8_21_14_0_10_39_9 TaxID=1974566 RepID=A0A2M6WNM1_9BACT|nr:MAG: hypothetical protein COT98_04265 [Candidatus Falkowbacteria bacterium CG10_big_fil_rev_8_21_14_0_10_39_9]